MPSPVCGARVYLDERGTPTLVAYRRDDRTPTDYLVLRYSARDGLGVAVAPFPQVLDLVPVHSRSVLPPGGALPLYPDDLARTLDEWWDVVREGLRGA